MDLIQASILGLVQGLTEYLPVSSSAHLVLVPQVLGWHFDPNEAFAFNVLVQLGTLLGVVVYFFKDLCQIARAMLTNGPEARLGWLVGLATIPAIIAGFFFRGKFESANYLLGTACLLVLAELLGRGKRTNIRSLDAIVMGFGQCLALLPGISRSGSTISVGVMLGLDKPTAARFSFFMSIPIILGAGLLACKELMADPSVLHRMLYPVIVGFVSSAVSGYLVIRWLLNFLKNQSLLWFAAYCALLGGALLFFN